MTENWSAIASEVKDAIDSVGADALLIGPPSAPDGPLGVTQADPAGESCKVVISDYSAMERASSSIAMDEIKLLVSVPGVTPPTIQHKVTVGGKTYAVLDVKALQPGGVAVLYELRAK